MIDKRYRDGNDGGPRSFAGRESRTKGKRRILPLMAVSVAAALSCTSCLGLPLRLRDAARARSLKAAQAEDAGQDENAGQDEDREQDDDSRLWSWRSGAGGSDSSKGAEARLVSYIDRAEKLVARAERDMEAWDEEEDVERAVRGIREQAGILEGLLDDLSDLQKKAEAVGGIDAELANAGSEYFSMACDAQRSYLEIWAFYADYFELLRDILVYRPQADEYESVEDYYIDLYTWYESAKERYGSIVSCPPCLTSQWEKYGEILDLNESICYKCYLAGEYGDILRYMSAQNMSDRFVTVEDLQFSAFNDLLNGEIDHFLWQMELASALAEEIRTYTKLGEGERGGYTFGSIRTGEIAFDYDVVDTIYPSLYNSYDAFLIVKTGCASGTRKILVEAEIPGFTQPYKETFTLDPAYKAICIKPPVLTGELDLSASKDAQINVRISEPDGVLLEAKTFPIKIKSKYDFEWYSDEYGISTKDNILCFLTPEASSVAQLKRQAIDEISSMTGGQMQSFIGYQDTQWENHYVGTYLQAAGLMRALYERGIRYSMDAFSISGSNQHILFPEDVLEHRSGLCIETSLVVASALQSAGMHVFLLFPPDHVQVAVEIWDGHGQDVSGTGEYFLIETTALSDDWEDTFIENANALLDYQSLGTGPIQYYDMDEWFEYLSMEDTYIIDCDDVSVLGLTPFAN